MSPAAKHRKHRGQGNEAPGLKAPILHISDAKALEVVFFLLHFPTTASCLGYKVNSAEWKDALLPKALQYHIKLPRDVPSATAPYWGTWFYGALFLQKK